jgi:hypothetical protein
MRADADGVASRAAHRKLSRRERRAAERNQRDSLTAAAAILRSNRGTVVQKKRWQDEAWDNWRSQGELWYTTEWKGNAISRVRLKAAKIVPGSDEPEIVEEGPAAELVSRLAEGVGGQSVLMKSFSIKLDIAGDSYFIMYEDDDGVTHSNVYSTDVIRKDNSGNFSIQVDESAWVPLPAESLVVRIWNPDEQFPWLAISPTEPALGTLREIDLYNRKIITELTARVASNGVWLIPDEVTFPVREEFSDAADPLISEFIDVASKAIQNPGSAAAALPIPMRVASEFIDKFKHIRFSDNVVAETLDGRDRALGRLAKMLNVPAEVLTGMGDVNHWGAWQIEDQAIRIHIIPTVETICRGLTVGYLEPGLSSQGLSEYSDDTPFDGVVDEDEEGVRYVVWYDASELEKKPDLGERAVQLHDRVAISDAALRRATGFDDADAPTDEERDKQILTKLAYNGQQAVNSYEMLTGTPVAGGGGEESTTSPGANLPAPEPATGATPGVPPDTSTAAPPPPGESTMDGRFLEIIERTGR